MSRMAMGLLEDNPDLTDMANQSMTELAALAFSPPCFVIMHDLGDFASLNDTDWIRYETNKSIRRYGPLKKNEERWLFEPKGFLPGIKIGTTPPKQWFASLHPVPPSSGAPFSSSAADTASSSSAPSVSSSHIILTDFKKSRKKHRNR